MKIAVAVVVGLALAGCVSTRQVKQDVDAAKDACRAQTFATKVALARCINSAEMKLSAVYDKTDLLQLRLASRLAIAEKQDRGEISDAQAELEFAQVNAQIGTQEASRNSNARIAAAASEMATPRVQSCTRNGNTVTCF